MKKFVRALMAVALFFGTAMAFADEPTWPELQSVYFQGIPAKGIKKVTITLKGEALVITKAEDENIGIRVESNFSSANPIVNADAKSIKIEQKDKTNKLNGRNVIVTLMLPEGFEFGDLVITQDTGALTLGTIKGANITVTSAKGSINAESLIADKLLKLSSPSGDITIQSIKAKNLEAETLKGTLTLKGVEADTFTVAAEKGTLEMDVTKMFEKDASVSVGSGNASIYLPDGADFWTTGTVERGRFRSSFPQDSKGALLKVKVGSGELQVTKR